MKPWDIAAGSLLVAEAGGTFTDEAGAINQLEARAFVGSNGNVHEDLRAIVVDTMPEHLH